MDSDTSKKQLKKVVKEQEKFFRRKIRENIKIKKLMDRITYHIEHNNDEEIKFYFRYEKYKLVFMDDYYYVVQRKKARYILKFRGDYLVLLPIEPLKI